MFDFRQFFHFFPDCVQEGVIFVLLFVKFLEVVGGLADFEVGDGQVIQSVALLSAEALELVELVFDLAVKKSLLLSFVVWTVK